MRELLTTQSFGIMLCLCFYIFGSYLYRKVKIPIFNPLLVAAVLLIIYVEIFRIDLDSFLTDLSGISVFLGPLIVCLAIPIAKQKDVIKKNVLPIFFGAFVGALSSIVVVIILGRIYKLPQEIVSSIIPKSATTPIAIAVAGRLGGIRAITVAVVVISAVLGAVIIPYLIKLTRIKDPRIIGISLGTTSQAIGTAKALEIDPLAGAIAGVSLVLTGLMTVFITMFF